MRAIATGVSVGLLLFLGVSGVQSFLGDWGLAETQIQRLATLGQIVFGIAGLSAGAGALLRRSWTSAAALVFAGAVAFSAWAGPVAWGEAGPFRSLLDAGLGFLMGFALYLGVSRVGKGGTPEGAPSSPEG